MKKSIRFLVAAFACAIPALPHIAAAQTAPAISPAISTPDKVETRIGPTQPANVKRGNWIQTMPGKGFIPCLRLYSPLEPFFAKTWRPSEVELVP